MDELEFKRRTRDLGYRVIELIRGMPRDFAGDIIARQLIRSATSVGANYRAACRGKSPADVIAKLGIVEEEADETMYWLEMLRDAGLVSSNLVEPILREANEVVAMSVASIRTLRRNINPKSKI
ncbi:MAG: four helix bundle protein [Anaerolinea sp.]|nr:four helix bundle protein [Anaerolinea sp.]